MSIGTNTPFGFLPYRISGSGNSTFNTEIYEINPANTTPIGVGDLVTFDSNGYVIAASAGTQSILGVFEGVTYLGANAPVLYTGNNNWTGVAPATGITVQANVYVSPTYIYRAQLSNAGITRNQLYQNFYCAPLTGAPNTATGQSTWTVDSSSFSSSPGTNSLKLVGLATASNGSIQNDWGIQYNIGLFQLTTPRLS